MTALTSIRLMERILRQACVAGILVTGLAKAAGFTEPPIVFYGSVTNENDGYSVPITSGALQWTITPDGSPPIVLTAPLSDLGSGVSYRLEIPVEKVPSGFTLSLGSLPAGPGDYTRDPVTLDGDSLEIVMPSLPGGAMFTYDEDQRGKIERVDLALTKAFLDTDGDGLPDWWEDLYGYDKYDGADPSGDDDGDGTGGKVEYADHTSPVDPDPFTYPRWALVHSLIGEDYPISADLDLDGVPHGVEFALDANPRGQDMAFVQSRVTAAVEDVGGQDFLVMTVVKPAIPRVGIDYLIAGSKDLNLWGMVENTDIVTLEENPGLLRVRLEAAVGEGESTAGFLRFQVVETP